MRWFGLIFVSVLAFVAGCAADEVPKVELGMGLSYSRMHVPNKSRAVDMSGIQFDATYNRNQWLGLTGEFTGHYRCLQACFWDSSFARNKAFTFVVGPRITFRRSPLVQPYLHAMGGVSNVSYSDDSGVDVAETGAALVAGGGLNMRIRRLTVRAFQADLLNHVVAGRRRNDVRVCVGVALGLGRVK